MCLRSEKRTSRWSAFGLLLDVKSKVSEVNDDDDDDEQVVRALQERCELAHSVGES